MNKNMIEKALPKWTKKIITETGGRDPLGLSRVSATITDYLLSGIITTTYRARYYSFYSWALWHIATEDQPKRYQDFVDGFRRREAMTALSTIANNPNTSPVGVETARAELIRGNQEKDVNCDFRVLPSNSLGGYGQYYAGSLYELGVTYRPEEDGIDRATPDIGEPLAKAFNLSIMKTPYITNKLYKKTSISIKDLETSKSYFTIDALFENSTTIERKLLVDLFFKFEKKNPVEKDLLRRLTLGQILYVISEYDKCGFRINPEQEREDLPTSSRGNRVDWYILCPAYYYRVLWPARNKTLNYNVPKNFETTAAFWRQFCLQEFFTQAIEGLLYGVLETAGLEPGGLKLEDIITRLLNHNFYETIKGIADQTCKTPRKLLETIGISDIPSSDISKGIQKKISLLHPLSEIQILKMEATDPSVSVAQAMMMLAVLYGKWRGVVDDYAYSYIASRTGNELWLGQILPFVDSWLKTETSWEKALKAIIETFILDQHDRIMYEKGRLDSCWIERKEGKIVKTQDYSPAWRSSRHMNAISILQDLGLLRSDKKNCLSLTKEGEGVLKKILTQE